jgi:hypothetical protein
MWGDDATHGFAERSRAVITAPILLRGMTRCRICPGLRGRGALAPVLTIGDAV